MNTCLTQICYTDFGQLNRLWIYKVSSYLKSKLLFSNKTSMWVCLYQEIWGFFWGDNTWITITRVTENKLKKGYYEVMVKKLQDKTISLTKSFNGSQLAKMKKSIPDMSLPKKL